MSIRWGKEGGRREFPRISLSVSDRERSFMVGFNPHHFISIRWGERRLIGGFLPHLSIRIKCREKRLKGDFPPHIFFSIWWVKDGLWGDSPLISESESDGGKKGNSPQIYLPELYVEKEWVIAVSLRETAIMRDFLQNPPSWMAYFGSNPHVSLAENLTVFGR